MKLCPNIAIRDYYKYERSWFDRLFSWPWRPWLSSVIIYSPQYEVVGGLIYCSFDTFKKTREGSLPWPDGVTELDGR